MGNMVPVPFMRSFSDRFSLPFTRRRPNAFALLLFQMSASGTLRSFRRDL